MLGFIIAGLIGWRAGHIKTAPEPSTPSLGMVADFNFTDQTGKPFGLKDLQGKYWVADFVFTRCMGPCPLITRRMSELQTKYPTKKDLHYVSFSVDPEFDTPKKLSDYAASYKADPSKWHFLTGPKTEMYSLITKSFHLAVADGEDKTPGITDILHSTHFVWVDNNGTVQGYFNSTDEDSVKNLEEKIAALP